MQNLTPTSKARMARALREQAAVLQKHNHHELASKLRTDAASLAAAPPRRAPLADIRNTVASSLRMGLAKKSVAPAPEPLVERRDSLAGDPDWAASGSDSEDEDDNAAAPPPKKKPRKAASDVVLPPMALTPGRHVIPDNKKNVKKRRKKRLTRRKKEMKKKNKERKKKNKERKKKNKERKKKSRKK